MAGPSLAQWNPALWPATTTVARAVWSNDAGVALTGSVVDARAWEMARALDERHVAIGLSTNAYRPKWYLWERANVVRFKAAASNALPHYAARWMAAGTDFTGPAAASNWTSVPMMTASNTSAHLGLPTNFWTFTPWVALNRSSNGWDNIRRVVDLMTWTTGTAFGTQDQHQAINRWSGGPSTYPYLYGDEYNDGPSWAEAKDHIDLSWANMTVSTYDGQDPEPIAWNCVTNTGWPGSAGPSFWSIARFDAGASTNWRVQAEAVNFVPQGVAVTNWERAADFYHTAQASAEGFDGTVTGQFAAAGHGVSTTAVRLVQVAAGRAATVTAASVVGTASGYPLAQPGYPAEPNGTTNATLLGYSSRTNVWVFRWDATTNGFRYVTP